MILNPDDLLISELNAILDGRTYGDNITTDFGRFAWIRDGVAKLKRERDEARTIAESVHSTETLPWKSSQSVTAQASGPAPSDSAS